LIISLYNVKGGVGKTTSLINLSAVAKKKGKTLIIDSDIQQASAYFFNLKNKKSSPFIKKTEYKSLDLIPYEFKNKIDLNTLKNDYDFIFIDAPAGIENEVLNIIKHSDLIIVPILPNLLSLRTYNEIIKMNLSKNVKLLLNRYENTALHKHIVKNILKLPSSQYFKNYIPKSERIEIMPFIKKSVIDKYPTSKEANVYKKVFEEII